MGRDFVRGRRNTGGEREWMEGRCGRGRSKEAGMVCSRSGPFGFGCERPACHPNCQLCNVGARYAIGIGEDSL